MITGDIIDLLTKRRHCLMGKDNVDRYFFNIILVGNSVKWPDELIGKKKAAKFKIGNRGDTVGKQKKHQGNHTNTRRNMQKHQGKW